MRLVGDEEERFRFRGFRRAGFFVRFAAQVGINLLLQMKQFEVENDLGKKDVNAKAAIAEKSVYQACK